MAATLHIEITALDSNFPPPQCDFSCANFDNIEDLFQIDLNEYACSCLNKSPESHIQVCKRERSSTNSPDELRCVKHRKPSDGSRDVSDDIDQIEEFCLLDFPEEDDNNDIFRRRKLKKIKELFDDGLLSEEVRDTYQIKVLEQHPLL